MNLIGTLCLLFIGLLGLTLFAIRRFWKIGIVLFIFSVAVSGYFIWQAQRWSDKSGLIQPGDNQEKVVELMGEPTFLAATPADMQKRRSQFGATPIAGCVKEYLYMAFFMPRVWVFCVDTKGTVINEYVLDSY